MSRRKRPELSYTDNLFLKNLYAMFCAMSRCYNALPDKSGINQRDICFRGFDAHSDYEKTLGDHYPDSYDSHACYEPFYRVLVARWEASADKENLTRDDLIRITKPPFFPA